jgi:hypothetical protein
MAVSMDEGNVAVGRAKRGETVEYLAILILGFLGFLPVVLVTRLFRALLGRPFDASGEGRSALGEALARASAAASLAFSR